MQYRACNGPRAYLHSSTFSTTIDYILGDIEASSCVESCWTHEEHELNTFDHLPVSAKLSGTVPTQEKHDPSWIKVDWTKAMKSDNIIDHHISRSAKVKAKNIHQANMQ